MKPGDLQRFFANEKKAASQVDTLDEREFEVVSLLSRGMPGHLMCQEMGITPEELKKLKVQVQKKLRLRNEIELLQFAVRQRNR